MAIVAAIGGIASAWLLPIGIARVSPRDGSYQERTIESPDSSDGKPAPCVPASFAKNLSAAVRLPIGMRFNETKRVTLRIALAREFRLSCGSDNVPEDQRVLKAHAALQSPGFDISPSPENISLGGADQLEWTWLIRPKSAGAQDIRLVTEGENGLSFNLQKILPPADWVDQSPHQIVASIEVLTELGLTGRQDAVLKALGAFLGILGVVFGYPFLALKGRNSGEERGDKSTTRSAREVAQKVKALSPTQWTLLQAVEAMDGQGMHHILAACAPGIGPSDSFHRLKSLQDDELITMDKGNVWLSELVKRSLGHRKLKNWR